MYLHEDLDAGILGDYGIPDFVDIKGDGGLRYPRERLGK
jgi:hypothetical protein